MTARAKEVTGLMSHGVAPDRHEDTEDEDAGDDEQPEVKVNVDHLFESM